MSLIVKVPNVAFTKTMPKLYRDAVVNAGTQFLYDAINPISYAKQAAPAAGNPSADKWTNLVNGTADGNIYAPSGEMTWGASGGFGAVGGPSEKIAALANATPAAKTKCLGIVWFKHGSGGSTNDVLSVWADMITLVHNSTTNRFIAAGSGTAPLTLGIDSTTKVGLVTQMAVAYDNASLALSVYVNGALYASTGGFQIIQAPTRPHSLMLASGYGSAYVGTFYRWLFDDLSAGKAPADIVALDYALNAGRFA